MAKKTRGGKKAKKAAKVLDPLPGPELLRPVRTYSEDNAPPLLDGLGREVRPSSFVAPPVDDNSDAGDDDDGSLHSAVPAEFLFGLEDGPDIDELNALVRAEENSDDAKEGSSYTEEQEEEPKPDDPDGNDTSNTESEMTRSETDLEGYDIASIESSWSADSKDLLFEAWSEEPLTDEKKPPGDEDEDTLKFVKPKPKKTPPSKYKEKSGRLVEPITQTKAEWVTRKFIELFTTKSDSKKPLHLSVKDVLEMNIDFDGMDAECVQKLRDIATAAPPVGPQWSADFERPSSSLSAESARRKLEVAAKAASATAKVVKEGKKSRATPKRDKKAKTSKELLPPTPKNNAPPFPAELYEESRGMRPHKKPWIRREELRGTNDERDACVTESCEDLNFIEYRREKILRGKRVPIGRKDFELDLIARRMAGKLLSYEAAIDRAMPDSGDFDGAEDGLPYEEQFALPPKPLIPIKTDPNEDPDDEDTTSEEDEKKRETKSENRHIDPYQAPTAVHEDDQHDYYNSDRSSSDCEPVETVIRKEVEKKIRQREIPAGIAPPTAGPLDIDGRLFNPTLPLDDADLRALPVDDLYALAHDLEMPPSELRKELRRPDEEMDYEADSDDNGWRFVRGTFLYEKTPAFYAVQIKDLEQQIRLKREQWILLELEYNEFSVKNRVEYTALGEFIVYLVEQRRKEKEKVLDLLLQLERKRAEAWKATEYQKWWTGYLEEQRVKMIERYAARKEIVQSKLFTLRDYVEKQRETEATLNTLRAQHKSIRAAYTQKVSKMLLSTGREKKQLFQEYERRIGMVFKEYQRALVLSMNDNLQEACRAHVDSRRFAKSFSDRAIAAMRGFRKAAIGLAVAQEKVDMKRELLSLSTAHGDRAERELVRLEKVREYEGTKAALRADSMRGQCRVLANIRKTRELQAENINFARLVGNLQQEKQSLMDHLEAEQCVNKQMENHLSKLVTAVRDYLEYLDGTTTEAKLSQLEHFEDRFIRYLHYAAEIENLVPKKSVQRPFLAEGDLGFVRRPSLPKR